MGDHIFLNLYGTVFEIPEEKLRKIPCFSAITQTEKPIFIEKSPYDFDHILKYLNDPNYKIPYFVSVESFGLDSAIKEPHPDTKYIKNSKCKRCNVGLLEGQHTKCEHYFPDHYSRREKYKRCCKCGKDCLNYGYQNYGSDDDDIYHYHSYSADTVNGCTAGHEWD